MCWSVIQFGSQSWSHVKMLLNLCLTTVALLSVGLAAADVYQDAYDGLFDDLDLDKVCSRPHDMRKSLLCTFSTFQVLSRYFPCISNIERVFQLNVSNAEL